MMKCGHKHGPYLECTYKVHNKTVNLKLYPEVAPLYRAAIQQYRKLKSLLGRIWLANASDVRFVDYAKDGNDTLIQLDVPNLGVAAPKLYEQAEFWPTKPSPEYTAVDVLSEVVDDVGRGDQDSSRYDRHLLRKLSGVRRVFSDHLQAVALPHGSNGKAGTICGSATAKAAAAVLLTTDKDFLCLHPEPCLVQYVDPTISKKAEPV